MMITMDIVEIVLTSTTLKLPHPHPHTAKNITLTNNRVLGWKIFLSEIWSQFWISVSEGWSQKVDVKGRKWRERLFSVAVNWSIKTNVALSERVVGSKLYTTPTTCGGIDSNFGAHWLSLCASIALNNTHMFFLKPTLSKSLGGALKQIKLNPSILSRELLGRTNFICRELCK